MAMAFAIKLLQARQERIAGAYTFDASSCLLQEAAFASDSALNWGSGDAGGQLGSKLSLEAGLRWRQFSKDEKVRLHELVDANMSQFYDAVSAWPRTRSEKRRDMANRDARYILVRDQNRYGTGQTNSSIQIQIAFGLQTG